MRFQFWLNLILIIVNLIGMRLLPAGAEIFFVAACFNFIGALICTLALQGEQRESEIQRLKDE